MLAKVAAAPSKSMSWIIVRGKLTGGGVQLTAMNVGVSEKIWTTRTLNEIVLGNECFQIKLIYENIKQIIKLLC